jgi:hypothetical protein
MKGNKLRFEFTDSKKKKVETPTIEEGRTFVDQYARLYEERNAGRPNRVYTENQIGEYRESRQISDNLHNSRLFGSPQDVLNTFKLDMVKRMAENMLNNGDIEFWQDISPDHFGTILKCRLRVVKPQQ